MTRDLETEIRGNSGQPFSVSSRIREEARRLGFFKVGIARAGPLPHPERLTSWINQGFHGEMRYMERQASKRMDPAKVLAGVRSLVLVAMNYGTEEIPASDPLKGSVSRYAWGSDYHEIVQSRLERLFAFIRKLNPSAAGKCYVDTGPVMEKAWGAQTSLGWIGKHTNLITKEQGSWFFLGSILLDFELEYDIPERDHCGSCQRCIDACPTGAIVAPYVLDARRCISYLTIESRDSIPEQLRSCLGNRIFGCDACQEVCPWNKVSSKTSAVPLGLRGETSMPDLAPLVDMTEEEFSARFEGRALLRAKRDGLVRNVVVALGNSGSVEAIPALERALLDRSSIVRLHAQAALKKLRFFCPER